MDFWISLEVASPAASLPVASFWIIFMVSCSSAVAMASMSISWFVDESDDDDDDGFMFKRAFSASLSAASASATTSLNGCCWLLLSLLLLLLLLLGGDAYRGCGRCLVAVAVMDRGGLWRDCSCNGNG